MRSGSLRPSPQKTLLMALISWGSPTLVPVPCASTYDTLRGSTPASSYTSLRSVSWARPEGNVMPSALKPSALALTCTSLA
uniref:Putative secreted protein n=1 Tax=Ixodes ricinus TaxID=34613 RepID=A0A6B0U6E8_IXORI